MTLNGKTILITGAARGIGRALLEEALTRGAATVYAGTRTPISHSDPRVVPLELDVTDRHMVDAAAKRIETLDILVNNAGIAQYDDLSDGAAMEELLAVNLHGLHAVTQALLPQLRKSRGVIINNVSLAAVAAVPIMPAYSVSKAAALSLTQSLRALLAPSGIRVHAVLPGPVDTDMTRGLVLPKADPGAVAQSILDAVANGDEEIFPDAMSASLADGWRSGVAKTLERQQAGLVSLAQ